MGNIKRIGSEFILSILILGVFLSGAYLLLPSPIQLVVVKVLLVSVGVLHAHLAGKLLFPTVDWKGEFRPAHFVRMVLYAIIPLCYAFGG